MLYAIHAYENMYGGLHGIESFIIVDCNSLEQAEQWAFDESCDVICSYSDILREFEEAAEEEDLFDDEAGEYIDECIREDVAYEIYPIVKEVDKTIEKLEMDFYNNMDDFIKKYCSDVV